MCGTDYGTSRPNDGRDDGMWKCKPCGRVLERTQENFYTAGDPERDGCPKDGLMVHCKSCHTQRSNQKRREALSEVENTLTSDQWEQLCREWDNECAYCGTFSDSLERDHVVPLSDGGGTTLQNIVPACMPCNRSKGNKSLSQWYPKQEFYDKQREAKIVHLSYDHIQH
jgi:endonuclease I